MTFDEVIGQEDAKLRLRALVEEDRVPHALMFCGPSGSGKLALALAFASYLLCQRRHDGDSCGSCPQCAMVRKWAHPDLHFTFPVIKASDSSADYKPVSDDFSREWHEQLSEGPYFTIDQWLQLMNAANQQAIITVKESDEISRKLSLKSSQGGFKISLIWLPERMNEQCANKLLKLIEEPPAQTVFLLVSEEPGQLLETIRSRTQRFDIRGINTADIQEALINRRGIDADAAQRIARVAEGSWTKALQILDADNESHRERKEDVEDIAKYFIKQYAPAGEPYTLSPDAIEKLRNHDWPGNIRELENVIQRTLCFTNPGIITADDLQIEEMASHPQYQGQGIATTGIKSYDAFQQMQQQQEIAFLKSKIHECGGSVSLAAEKLGMLRTTLYNRLSRLGVNIKELR